MSTGLIADAPYPVSSRGGKLFRWKCDRCGDYKFYCKNCTRLICQCHKHLQNHIIGDHLYVCSVGANVTFEVDSARSS